MAFIIVGVFLAAFYYLIQTNDNIVEQQPVVQSDTLTISGVAAVYLSPMGAWIEERKRVNEDDFYTAADDYVWYKVHSRDFLESQDIKIVDTDQRYINFIKDDGSHILLDRYIKDEEGWDRRGWGLYLFDGKQDPYDASMVDMEFEYEKYFK